MRKIELVHAGEILFEEFMRPMQPSQHALAWALHVSPRRINEIVNGRRAISADTALRLTNRSQGGALPGS